MFGDTPLIIVEDDATLREIARSLRDRPVIGIDTESDSFHHYREKLCLVQISDTERDIIVDPLAVPDLSPLGELFENPEQVHVLHGADYDVVSLKRDFGFGVRNIFDTMIAARFLGFQGVGLADLVERYFGYRIDKKYQRHDWSRRPLEPEHLEYARGDTHYLPALRDVLERRLARAGRLDAAREEFRILEDREWSGRTAQPSDFMRLKRATTLDETGRRVLRALWTYRDAQARAIDRPGFRVIPDRVLVDLAATRPTDEEGLYRVARKGSKMLRRHGKALLAAVQQGLADTEPLPEPPPSRERRSRPASRGPGVDRLFTPLKNWRNAVVEREGLDPVVVANNQLLKEIARAAPSTLDELRAIDGIRNWQVERYGEDLLAVVREVVEEAARSGSGQGRRRRRRRR